MDTWIQRSARTAHGKRVTTVYVCLDDGDEIVAVFAFGQKTMTSVEIGKVEASGLGEVPALLLGRLALREDLQGQGFGEPLLIESMVAAVRAAELSPARLFVVDAKDEGLAQWYAKVGLKRTTSDPLRLYRSMSRIEKTLRAAGRLP